MSTGCAMRSSPCWIRPATKTEPRHATPRYLRRHSGLQRRGRTGHAVHPALSGAGRAGVLLFNANYGQHLAIMAGFQHVRGNRVVTLDADLQNPPEEIPRLLAKMDDG